MLTKDIKFKHIKSNTDLKNLLNEYYLFFIERIKFKGYRYEQDRWESNYEHTQLINKIQEFKYLYLQAYGHSCPLCSRKIMDSNSKINLAHPIGKNREYPELITEVKNLMPLCNECDGKYNVSYEKQTVKDIKSIYDLTKKVPNIVIPHLESTLNHVTKKNHKYILSSRRFNSSIARFCPEMLEHINDYGEPELNHDTYAFKIYNHLHRNLNITSNSDYDFDYAKFVYQKNKNYSSLLTKNSDDQFNYISFLPVNFIFSNLREFKKNKIDLSGKKYLCILGENGVGKTTLMQSIYSSISSDKNKEFYGNEFSYRKDRTLNLTFEYISNNSPISKIFNQEHSTIKRYQVENSDIKRFKKDLNVISLNDNRNNYGRHEKELNWLFEQSNSTFSKVAIIIKNFLDLDDSTLYRNKSSIFADFNGKRQNLGKLSSGYKAIISLIISLYKQLELTNKSDVLSGEHRLLALIDEIELHLHPKWKTAIVNKLTDNFPDIFFIITTHDPLVLQQCDDNLCLKIVKNEKNQSVLNEVIDFGDYDVDMLLSSPIFEADYEPAPQERLKKETLRQFLARKIVNESLQKLKQISVEELSLRLELAVRNEKNRT